MSAYGTSTITTTTSIELLKLTNNLPIQCSLKSNHLKIVYIIFLNKYKQLSIFMNTQISIDNLIMINLKMLRIYRNKIMV